MPAQIVRLAGLVPVTFQEIVLTNSTAVGFNSTARTAIGRSMVADISVETTDVRYRFDSTGPLSTTGVIMQKDTLYRWEGFDGTGSLANLKFIGDGGAAAVVSFQFWKYQGSDT